MPWQKTRADRQRDAQVYGPEYKRNRAIARRRANGYCEQCDHRHNRLECDHRHPASATGRPDHSLAKLRMLCTGPGSCKCHERKTATEGGGYRSSGQRQAADPEPRRRTAF